MSAFLLIIYDCFQHSVLDTEFYHRCNLILFVHFYFMHNDMLTVTEGFKLFDEL